MEFAPPNLNIAKLKRKTDISGLTIQIQGSTDFINGRYYLLWKNGVFLVIQGEPWCRPGYDPLRELVCPDYGFEERRAVLYFQEVIQTMLDTIVFDGENNWAYLVRLKDGTYRLAYKKRQWVNFMSIWTKVVELSDIEMTRFVTGLQWEGIYEGKDVDLLMGWIDYWAIYVANESKGQKLVQSMGVGHYFFELKAHVSQNGVVVGIMMEPIVGRRVTPADRSAVFEAVADIQRHGITFIFQICDIYITERGVRFASASSARYYQDPDVLAEKSETKWRVLANIFGDYYDDILRFYQTGSRSMRAHAWIIPRLPTLTRPVTMTREEAVIRLVWSMTMSDEFVSGRYYIFERFNLSSHQSGERTARLDKRIKGDKRAVLAPDDASSDLDNSVTRIAPVDVDQPLVLDNDPVVRWRPYVRPKSKRLLLPPEPNVKHAT